MSLAMTTGEETNPPAARPEPGSVPVRAAAPTARDAAAAPGTTVPALAIRQLSVYFGANQVLKEVSLEIEARAVTAIIGPSGCGKSTFLRALNRMHELVPEARMTGEIRLFGEDIYAGRVEPVIVRRRARTRGSIRRCSIPADRAAATCRPWRNRPAY